MAKKVENTQARTITEPARELPILDEVDVLVIGGGPAGIAASVAAARLGARSMIVEQHGCLGGLLTVSAMEPPSWWRQAASTMPGGIVEDLDNKMIALGATAKTFFNPSAGYAYDTEMFKYVADEFIRENGVIPLLHCLGTAPLIDGKSIIGVVTESKSGRTAILAKRVIDCTGDADIAFRAGIPTLQADEPTGNLPAGELMGGTLVYGLTDVDTEKLEAHADSDPAIRHPSMHRLFYDCLPRAEANGDSVPANMRKTFVYSRVTRNEIPALNHVWIKVDGTDVRSLTAAEMDSRKAIVDTLPLMRKYIPGCENAKLRNFAMAIGIRETRRVVGEYQLTFNDVFAEQRFPDTVGVYPICMDGPEGCLPAYTPAYFQVPYRVVVPLEVDNILVAGRCVSGRRRAISITRQVDFAMVTGQAAGVAAAVSAASGDAPRHVDVSKVQAELKRQHVRID